MSKLVSKHKSRRFRRFLRANQAVSALEYAILVGVIAAAVGGAIIAFGGSIEKGIQNIEKQVKATASKAVTAATPAAP